MENAAQPQIEAPVTFETALHENVTLNYRPAPIGKRILAYVIDVGIVSAVLYGVFLSLVVIGGLSGFLLRSLLSSIPEDTRTFFFMMLLVFLLIVLGVAFEAYFIYFELKKSLTPGKRLFGLQVIALDGAKLTFSHVLRRSFMRAIDCYLILPGIVTMLLNDRRQRLGDLMANTMVIHSSHKEKQQDFIYINQSEYERVEEMLSHFNRDTQIAPSLTTEIAEAYLARAFPQFVLGKSGFSSEAEASSVAIQYFPNLQYLVESKQISVEHAIRYFSEKCFQFLNQ